MHRPWTGRYSGKRISVSTTGETNGPERARLQTFYDVIRLFHTHPEATRADAHECRCSCPTVGLLRSRVVQETYISHVGDEANTLQEVEVGLEQNSELIYTEYQRLRRDAWTAVILPQASAIKYLGVDTELRSFGARYAYFSRDN